MTKLQILCVGPPKTGKTTLCNYLADLQNTLLTTEYHPTQGVRILEFDKEIKNVKVNVELWDCSGDARFLSVWKSLHGVKGVIFVTDGKEQLIEYVESIPDLGTKQLVIFNNKIDTTGNGSKFKTSTSSTNYLDSKILKKLTCANTCLDQNPRQVVYDFDAFLTNVYGASLEEQRSVESAIVA